MDVLGALGTTWFALTVLIPVQIFEALGWFWTMVIALVIMVATRQMSRWYRRRENP